MCACALGREGGREGGGRLSLWNKGKWMGTKNEEWNEDWNMEQGVLEWDTYLCTAFISLYEVFIVKLSPGEDVTPVAKVIGTVRKTIPENKN